MRLFHVSEEPDIVRFVPRTPSRGELDQSKGLVWAIDECCLPNFLTPRECPRVTYRAFGKTTEDDITRFFSSSCRHCVAIEHAWYQRMQKTALYIYEFDSSNFYLQDEAAGYYVSEHTETPIGKIRIGDIFAELFKRNIEIRLVHNLWILADAVIKSTLDYSLCKMPNAQPSESRSNTSAVRAGM